MMSRTTFLQRRLPALRAAFAAAAVAACLPAAPAMAGQAGATFQVSVTLSPSGSNSCATATGTNAPQVTCRPTVGLPAAAAPARSGDSTLLGVRQREAMLKDTGELVEINDDNHYAWGESNYFALGEYSSRLVRGGRIEYVEMTVSW